MQNKLFELFIQNSYKDNFTMYRMALDDVNYPRFDDIILTASNELQANAFSLQIEDKKSNGMLPPNTDFNVIPDAGGRIGSGGATLGCFRFLLEKYENDMRLLKTKKILIIHSGGDSKRSPHNSAIGKLFSKIPRENEFLSTSTLFDELLFAFSGIPGRMESGVIVASGDAVMIFNNMQIDLLSADAVAFAMKDTPEEGAQHGVFLADEKNTLKAFLHKNSAAALREKGAVNQQGKVDLDIGLTFLSSDIMEAFLSLVLKDGKIDAKNYGLFVSEAACLNFYGDFLYPFGLDSTLEEYLGEPAERELSQSLIECRRRLFHAINGKKMTITHLSPGRVVPFGTSGEILNVVKNIDAFANLGFKKSVSSNLDKDDCIILNSFIAEGASLGPGSYVEDCWLGERVNIGSRCIVSGVHADAPVKLNDGNVLHMMIAENGYVARIYGVSDNPKETLGSFMNAPVSAFLEQNRLSEQDIWTGPDRTLWTAELFPVCETELEALRWAAAVQDGLHSKLEEWKKARRVSLARGLSGDIARLLKAQKYNEHRVKTHIYERGLAQGAHNRDLIPLFGKGDAALTRAKLLLDRLESGADIPWNDRMRLYAGLSEVVERLKLGGGLDKNRLLDAGFEEIRKVTLKTGAFKTVLGAGDVKPIVENRTEVHSPVRVNLSGSWSDAPPYCYERDGVMLNAAVMIENRYPVRVCVEKLEKPVIELHSCDLNHGKEFDHIESLKDFTSFSDPFTLSKAALFLSGTLSMEGSLAESVAKLGCGLKITTDVAVPKGSGLGTSSILAGTILKALYAAAHRQRTNKQLFDDVLCLEQMITTGGGWQDQIGGLTPGIKLTKTAPCVQLDFDIRQVQLSSDTLRELNERMFLLDTGQKRLAKSVLRKVLQRYIVNDESTLRAIEESKRNAIIMKYELENNRLSEFCRLLNRHMELAIVLDSTCTNTCIDHIAQTCGPYVEGLSICGAGGGGFMFGVMRKDVSIERLREALEDIYADTLINLYRCNICYDI